MRGIQETVTIACQIHFVTIGTADYNADITSILNIIRASGLDYETGSMATIVRGPANDVCALLANITHEAAGKQFVLHCAISNVCGLSCEVT